MTSRFNEMAMHGPILGGLDLDHERTTPAVRGSVHASELYLSCIEIVHVTVIDRLSLEH
jgi:hypothetical protein